MRQERVDRPRPATANFLLLTPPSPPGGQMGECKAETLERTESQTLAAQIVARHKNKKEQVRSKCCIVM